MKRLGILPAAAVALVVSIAACGSDDGAAIETLPPIRTTTSSSTSSTSINPNRIFYTVKPGENLNLIAKSFEVPLKALVDINNITDPDSVPAGVTLEIPTGIQEVADLPTTVETTEP